MHLSDQPFEERAAHGALPGSQSGLSAVARRPVRRVRLVTRRPSGVKLVAYWLGYGAFISALNFVLGVSLLPVAQMFNLNFVDALGMGSDQATSAADTSAVVGAGILFAITLVYGALSYGVWKMSETARKFAIAWLALALVLALAGVVTSDSGASLIKLVGASLTGASIVYLLRPDVRAAFRARWSPVRRP